MLSKIKGIVVILLILLQGCSFIDDGNYKIQEIEIFKDTPVWVLAQAVKYQNIDIIKRFLEKNPELVNYQESQFGTTVLTWAVGSNKYNSAKTLLELGADPDISTIPDNKTPLYIASGFLWNDFLANKDPKFVKLLLGYGANPNICSLISRNNNIEWEKSPLINSIGTGLEKTKLLIENGASLNYKTRNHETGAIVALYEDSYPEYAHYLIVENNAKILDPYYSIFKDSPTQVFYPVNLLRDWIFDLDSDEYKMKMEIVKEFERQGVNYWETEIPEFTLNNIIKRRYPDTWEEYIKRY